MTISRQTFTKQSRSTLNYLWLSWISILIIILLIHCLTISISPTIWQDEVQIIDFGRTALNFKTDWSINWDFTANKPVAGFSYLGTTLQEVALQLTHFSVFGPRLASILGAMAAATAALGWLITRNIPAKAAWIISLVFLLDPLFVQGYRGARVDCWVFAVCLSSCWLLKIAQRHFANTFLCNLYSALAGSLAVVAFFTWPSAILLYPLVALELFSLVAILRTTSGRKKILCQTVIAFISGGILASIILILPFWEQVYVAFSDTAEMASSRSGFSKVFDFASWQTLLELFKLSPFLPLVALVALRHRSQRELAIATLFTIALVVSTSVYIHRAVYLLPYFIALVGSLYTEPKSSSTLYSKQIRFKFLILILLLLWASSMSLIFRPATALSQANSRNSNLIEQAARSSIGSGNHKVLLADSMAFYYAGRKLGWHLFSDTFLDGSMLPNHHSFEKFLEPIDYIISSEQVDSKLITALERAHFKRKSTLLKLNQPFSSGKTTAARPYGPYWLFSK
jgi:hypothetical protein